ncbi:MAG TPA: APC family permease [Chthoniobacteraceae bacterium]|nr:APC family permease [Chthoniobacteraceae bacterium]
MTAPLSPVEPAASAREPELQRGIGFWQAAALNMSNMVGIGPFITIPLLMSATGLVGPQAMLAWPAALIIALADALVWAELGAALPGSGGTYNFLRDGLGARWGRLMSFLFIWQFLFSGPLEIASGLIGMAQYLRPLWPGATDSSLKLATALIGIACVVVLYRPIGNIGRIMIALWVGTLATIAAVIFTGATHFDAARAFDFPPGAWTLTPAFFLGLGAAARVGMYDYLGYYNVCHLGDEVREPGRVIPRSMLLSLVVIAMLYAGINLSIIGIVPWREFVPATDPPAPVVSMMMERVWGAGVSKVITVMVLITAVACVVALILGYSRIPFAAARDGNFFRVFARLHPTGAFPYVSLIVVGALSVSFAFFPLGTIVDALFTTRIVVQFCGQIIALMALRRLRPEMPRPFKMWLYPLPAFVAFSGWIFLLVTTDKKLLAYGASVLLAGLVCFLVLASKARRWPFQSGTSVS